MTIPHLTQFIAPVLAGVLVFGAVSCSQPQHYAYPPAAGGGFYVTQSQPWNKMRNSVRQAVSQVPKWASRVTGGFDDSYWRGDDVPGKPLIRIVLSEQRIYYYKSGKLVGEAPVSTGREGYGTTPGKFRITEKDIDHKSSWYGDYVDAEGYPVMREIDVRKDRRPPGAKFDGANMRYFMRVNGPIGMHEGYLPGYAASHGCIRLPSHMASAFYHATPLGTPVEIVR